MILVVYARNTQYSEQSNKLVNGINRFNRKVRKCTEKTAGLITGK